MPRLELLEQKSLLSDKYIKLSKNISDRSWDDPFTDPPKHFYQNKNMHIKELDKVTQEIQTINSKLTDSSYRIHEPCGAYGSLFGKICAVTGKSCTTLCYITCK